MLSFIISIAAVLSLPVPTSLFANAECVCSCMACPSAFTSKAYPTTGTVKFAIDNGNYYYFITGIPCSTAYYYTTTSYGIESPAPHNCANYCTSVSCLQSWMVYTFPHLLVAGMKGTNNDDGINGK